MKNNKIWATFEDSFEIDCPVIKWDEENGLNFLKKNKFNKSDLSLQSMQEKIKQFCIHWSVTWRANHMYNGLNSRGLSCNFMIDDDVNESGYATIYQCLPLMYGGWSQGGIFNSIGRGVEISYMPQAWEDKNLYNEANRKKWNVQKHEITTANVHGKKLSVFLPTEAQIKSLTHLMWGVSEILNIPQKFPRDINDNFHETVLENAKNYSGFINHYNITRNKIDAAGLDLQYIEDIIEGLHIYS